MNEITTNDRFDTLTNLDISTHYRDIKLYLFSSSILSAFAYWVISQNPNKELINIIPALTAYREHLSLAFPNSNIPVEVDWDSLKALVNDDLFEDIPEIMALNTMKPDFIDLGALARNVFYMVLREYITQQSK